MASATVINDQVYFIKRDATEQYSGSLYKIEAGKQIKIAERIDNNTFLDPSYSIMYGGNSAVFFIIPEDSDYPESDDGIRELYIVSQNNPPFKAMEIDKSETGSCMFSSDAKYFSPS